MSKSKNFTKKQLKAITDSMERTVNSWEPDIIDRCSEKNIKEVHKILEECLNTRIELKKAGDEAVDVLREEKTEEVSKKTVVKKEESCTVKEDFDTVELDDSLLASPVVAKTSDEKIKKKDGLLKKIDGIVIEVNNIRKLDKDDTSSVSKEILDGFGTKLNAIKTLVNTLDSFDDIEKEIDDVRKMVDKLKESVTLEKELTKKLEGTPKKTSTKASSKETEKVDDKTKKTSKKKASTKKTDDKDVKEVEKAEASVEEPVKSIKEEVKDVHVVPKFSDSLDIAISFDTTGSMYSVLATVRRDIKDTVRELFRQFGDKKLRISIIAHGDYCDKNNPYTIKVLDFTNDESKICSFVTNVESTYGGDSDECYELVLNTARTALNWHGGSEKILMMIGDCNPHNVGYKCREMSKPNEIDWENESKLLNDMGVRIYGVHALHHYRHSSKKFYETISRVTNGVYLTLDNFSDVLQLVSATCYKNHSEESYNDFITIIKENNIGGRTLWDNIRRLNGEIVDDESSDYYKRESSRKTSSRDLVFKTLPGLHPVPAGRFQVISVPEVSSIKGFVESNGIKYKVGRAFYELTKTEDVQQYKEIILQDKASGDMYYGDDARKHLGLLPQCTRSGSYAHEKIKPTKGDSYRVFVQSTSVNRKLMADTKLLYEISEI